MRKARVTAGAGCSQWPYRSHLASCTISAAARGRHGPLSDRLERLTLVRDGRYGFRRSGGKWGRRRRGCGWASGRYSLTRRPKGPVRSVALGTDRRGARRLQEHRHAARTPSITHLRFPVRVRPCCVKGSRHLDIPFSRDRNIQSGRVGCNKSQQRFPTGAVEVSLRLVFLPPLTLRDHRVEAKASPTLDGISASSSRGASQRLVAEIADEGFRIGPGHPSSRRLVCTRRDRDATHPR